MKKIILLLAVLIGFGLSTNASSFGKKQTLCCTKNAAGVKEKIVFETEGTFKVYEIGRLTATGFYDYSPSKDTIKLNGVRDNEETYELTFKEVKYSSEKLTSAVVEISKNKKKTTFNYKSC